MIKTLYQILMTDEYSVVIPEIQRDYAQGRKNEEDKRRDFLGEIKKYLQSNETLKLDFIFGSKDDVEKKFVPIDGQQRITTLWLLYWFLAVKTNHIAESEVYEWLHRFAYKTRNSSSEFCEKMCYEFQKVANVNDHGELVGRLKQYPSLADYIQNQTWFFTEYKHDPTIDAMLRTISGDVDYINVLIARASKIKEEIEKTPDFKSNNDLLSLYELIKKNKWEYVDIDDLEGMPKTADLILRQSWFNSQVDLSNPSIKKMLNQLDGEKYFGEDCLEGVFYECDYEAIWKRLTTDNAIVFEEIDVGGKQLPVTDDLYVKMNSRGKNLTSFENFKSDFITWLRESKNPNTDKICKAIDKEWTDVILRTILNNYEQLNKKDMFEGVLDDVFFSFINRFVFYKLYLKNKLKKDPSSDDFDKNPKVLFFQGKKTSDDKEGSDLDIRYSRFDYYKEIMTNEDADELNHIFLYLNHYRGFIDDLTRLLNKHQVKNVSFIPQYKTDKDSKNVYLQSTTYKCRAYFQAIFNFILSCDSKQYDILNLERWIRVSRNIIENIRISNVNEMFTCCKLIEWFSEMLKAENSDIYAALYKYKGKLDRLQVTAQRDQVVEEIEKVEAIIDKNVSEIDITNAENHAFFRGCIRFLFLDENGNVNWKNFSTKFNNAKDKWFVLTEDSSTDNANTEEDEYDAGVEKSANEVSVNTVRNFLRCFNSFSEILGCYLFTKIGYHHRKHCWKKEILLKPELRFQINMLLMANTDITFASNAEQDYKDFVEGDWPTELYEMNDSFKISLIEYGGKYTFHKDRLWYDYLFVGPNRKTKCEFLIQDGRFSIENAVCRSGYLYGKDILFSYNNQTYCWSVKEGNLNEEAKDKIYKKGDEKKTNRSEVEWKDTPGFNLIAEIDNNLK